MKRCEYIINNRTFAILPLENKKSKVIENNKEYIFNVTPKYIISKNCQFNGSSYETRRKITEKLTGDTYKSPILLNNIGNVIMFPTESPRLETCCWINYKNIKNYIQIDNDKVQIKFYEGKPITISSSLNVIKNQILKSNFLNFRITTNL